MDAGEMTAGDFKRPDGERWVDHPPLRICPAVTSKDLQIGYGRVQAHIFDALEMAGGIEWVNETDFDWDYRLFFGWPRSWVIGHDFDSEGLVPDAIAHTMYEQDTIPEGWVNVLNRFRLVWVPSHWCRDVFVEAGVKRPVMVSGYGADPMEFPYMQRYDDEPFTFITIGHDFFGRKGVSDVWHCFNRLKLGGKLKGAKLIVKTQKGMLAKEEWLLDEKGKSFQARDEHGNVADGVTFRFKTMSQRDYTNMLGHAHCLVYPQHAEGFGLIPLEFMCTGGAAMVTNRTGCKEYLNGETAMVLPPAVSKETLMERMVWAYENRESIREMGERAAEYVRSEWSWLRAGLKARRLLFENLGR